MPQISEDDFFAKNPEYRVWLSEKEKKAFGDLSDADARSYFKKFVKKWNAGELKEKFYKGITYSELPTHARTTHTWGLCKEAEGSLAELLPRPLAADAQRPAQSFPSSGP